MVSSLGLVFAEVTAKLPAWLLSQLCLPGPLERLIPDGCWQRRQSPSLFCQAARLMNVQNAQRTAKPYKAYKIAVSSQRYITTHRPRQAPPLPSLFVPFHCLAPPNSSLAFSIGRDASRGSVVFFFLRARIPGGPKGKRRFGRAPNTCICCERHIAAHNRAREINAAAKSARHRS